MLRLGTLAYQASRIRNFENLELFNEYLAVQMFPTHLVYFRAAWNPACSLTEQHINAFAQKHDINIFRIDSDVAPKISQHYGVRSEPEFVFCVDGDEVVRQVGPNYEGLIDKYNKIQNLLETLEKEKRVWSPYGSKF